MCKCANEGMCKCDNVGIVAIRQFANVIIRQWANVPMVNALMWFLVMWDQAIF